MGSKNFAATCKNWHKLWFVQTKMVMKNMTYLVLQDLQESQSSGTIGKNQKSVSCFPTSTSCSCPPVSTSRPKICATALEVLHPLNLLSHSAQIAFLGQSFSGSAWIVTAKYCQTLWWLPSICIILEACPVFGQLKPGILPYIVINKKDDNKSVAFINAQKAIDRTMCEKEQCL